MWKIAHLPRKVRAILHLCRPGARYLQKLRARLEKAISLMEREGESTVMDRLIHVHEAKNQHKWIVANFLGISLYTYFASWIWVPAGESQLPGAGADPILWSLSALPILMLFVFVNLIWTARSQKKIRYGGSWVSLLAISLVIAVWVSAFLYDGLRHYAGTKVIEY